MIEFKNVTVQFTREDKIFTAVDAAIIDSKTNGALSDTCMQEKKPWIQSNEFDFDSVN